MPFIREPKRKGTTTLLENSKRIRVDVYIHVTYALPFLCFITIAADKFIDMSIQI
ncbi:hypothetical protein WUBG_09637, partial [Wuchereria bancrofti]